MAEPAFSSAANEKAFRRLTKGRFPHLSGREIPIAVALQASGFLRGFHLEWDVCVGQYVDPEAAGLDAVTLDYRHLLCKRIDLVASRPDALWIVEFKPVLGMGGIGQLVTYRDLLVASRKLRRKPDLLYAVGDNDPDVFPTVVGLGISVFLMGEGLVMPEIASGT